MNAPAPAQTQLRATLREADGRILIRFAGSSWAEWDALRQDFRRTFLGPGSRLTCYRAAERCWSVKASERVRLWAWIDAWELVVREVSEW